LRSIISTHEFDRQVGELGGAKAIDDALAPFIEALTKDPYGFPLFQNDFTSFRYLRTREVAMAPALVIVFTIDENKNVVLEHIEAIS